MENITVFQNIGHMFSFLAKKSSWQADRARRIFDNGCPKERVKQICAEPNYFVREQSLDEEERKLLLLPMAQSIYDQIEGQLVGDYKKMEYQVGHQTRVIERMKEREEWFQERIAQLEKFGTTVATELSEMKKKHPEPPPPPSADGRPPPLTLGANSSLPHHEHAASVCRKSVLDEENMVGGMTPTLPLLPIPSHSLKKQVSWHEIGASVHAAEEAVQEEAYDHTCRDSEFFVYSEEGAATHRPSMGGATGLI
jgi:hypothetical protein